MTARENALPNTAPPNAAVTDLNSICVTQVSKQFRGHKALAEVSFTSDGAESIAIVGVNGAGKTTLLRCLLDFSRPDQGEISIAGFPNRDPHARSRLAFLPERFVMPPHLTGLESLRYLANLNDVDFDSQRATDALAAFEFPLEAAQKRVRDYSKGMLQKLGLASIALSRKPWLILDEPMSGLDPQGRRLVVKLIKDAREAGQGVLFTMHTLQGLEVLCDRLMVIHQGRLVYLGTPLALLQRHGKDDLEQAFLAQIESHRTGPLQ